MNFTLAIIKSAPFTYNNDIKPFLIMINEPIKSVLTGLNFLDYKKGIELPNGSTIEIVYSKSSKHVVYSLEGSKRIYYEYEFIDNNIQNLLNKVLNLILRAEEKFKNTAADDIIKRAIPIFDLIFKQNLDEISEQVKSLEDFINDKPAVIDILGLSDNHVVWLNEKNEPDFVFWGTLEKFSPTLAEYFRLRALGLSFIPTKERKKFSSQLGAALSKTFLVKSTTQAAFKDVELLISKTIENSLRTKYTFTTTAAAATSIFLCMVVLRYFYTSEFAVSCLYTISGGIIGSFISVHERARMIKCEIHDPIGTIVFQAIVRILLGGVFGFIAFILAQMGFAFSIFKESSIGLIFIGVASGFSERLIPELLQNIAKEKTKPA